MSIKTICIFENLKDLSVSVIEDGIFGTTFNKNGEKLFLRMELLNEKNAKCWSVFKEMTCWIANQNSRGVLSTLVSLAGKSSYPKYEDVKEVTGFTDEEYINFTEKAIQLKNKTKNKIVTILAANSAGSNHMYTFFEPERAHYIVYVSKNPNFSIEKVDINVKEFSLKSFIQSYSDILISVGSDFSGKESFHNRGISRNPYWVFEEKYSGLAMLLHGFTAVVADRYFPDKKFMCVKPIGSMQCIIQKNLLPEEGYLIRKNNRIDLAELEFSPDDPEGEMNYIKVSALKRIYNLAIDQLQ